MISPRFLAEHRRLTRRFFVRSGAAGLAAFHWATRTGRSQDALANRGPAAQPKAGARPDPYFTPQADFRGVSRGKPLPYTLSEEKKRAVGLTRASWRLDVIADPANPPLLGGTFTTSASTAIDFQRLLAMGQTRAVRFAKVMTCLSIGCPLGMGLWEGVPLRDFVWLTQPREKLRRVFYYGYHNGDPTQIFRSSLPVGRVLEDPFDLPPVIVCYKLNGQSLDSERGGPVRMVVPEAYGFKSVKWLSHVVLSNGAHANDTYADADNDVDSPMKTFAASLDVAGEVPAGRPIAVSGYAQVGLGGLSKVRCGCRGRTTNCRRMTRITRRHRSATPSRFPPPDIGAICPTEVFPPGRTASTTRAGRKAGRCDSPRRTGRPCCRDCRPGSTRSGAGPSMKRGSRSRCRGRCGKAVMPRSRRSTFRSRAERPCRTVSPVLPARSWREAIERTPGSGRPRHSSRRCHGLRITWPAGRGSAPRRWSFPCPAGAYRGIASCGC